MPYTRNNITFPPNPPKTVGELYKELEQELRINRDHDELVAITGNNLPIFLPRHLSEWDISNLEKDILDAEKIHINEHKHLSALPPSKKIDHLEVRTRPVTLSRGYNSYVFPVPAKNNKIENAQISVKSFFGNMLMIDIGPDTTLKQLKEAIKRKDPAMGDNPQIIASGREFQDDTLLLYPLIKESIDFHVRPRITPASTISNISEVAPNDMFFKAAKKDEDIERKQESLVKLVNNFVVHLESKLPPPRERWDKNAAACFVSSVVGALTKGDSAYSSLKANPEDQAVPRELIRIIDQFVNENPGLRELQQHSEFAKNLKRALYRGTFTNFLNERGGKYTR